MSTRAEQRETHILSIATEIGKLLKPGKVIGRHSDLRARVFRLISSAYELGRQLGRAESLDVSTSNLNELVNLLGWVRQTIHQAYHHEGSMQDCQKNTCNAITQALRK